MTRYALLDHLLQDRRHNWSIKDMTNYLNERLPEYGQNTVSKRTVEMDIQYLEWDSPFEVEIERFKVDAPTMSGDGVYKKQCLRYADPAFSIFRKSLSEDEQSLLASVLSTLGSFKGQPNFEWLEDLAERLNIKQQHEIISMSKNISDNSTMLAELYHAISSKAVINLYYHTFNHDDLHTVELSPYLLKEYNNRWYLLASPFDSDRILSFALDRIDKVEYTSGKSFKEPNANYTERYEDIVGITFHEDRAVERILFWVSDKSVNYVKTKPIHDSQIHLSAVDQENLHAQYPQLPGGSFFIINCIENYELIRELSSFGAELIVLTPDHISNQIYKVAKVVTDRYSSIKLNE